MTKVLHGIVHGKFIEVTEDLGLLDGQAVELIVTAEPSPGPIAEGLVLQRRFSNLLRSHRKLLVFKDLRPF